MTFVYYQPGQHPKELNPYWKDGGVGLPEEETESRRKKENGTVCHNLHCDAMVTPRSHLN